MLKFTQALQKKNMGYVYRMAICSDEMLDATLEMNTSAMEQIWEETHDAEIPLLQYNNEDSLSCVVTLVYLNARDTYRFEREEKTEKGYADFIFHPQREGNPAIILKLKKDSSSQTALKQIHEKKLFAEGEGLWTETACRYHIWQQDEKASCLLGTYKA